MAGVGSLKAIANGIKFNINSSNIGIGGSYLQNIKLAIINNSNSWKNTIFKNNLNSDYVSIGLYDSNFSNNPYIAAIDNSTDLFKDLYINNLGISSQPASLIGNVIINGKTTIGHYCNSIDQNYILDVYSKTSNNLAIFRNSNTSLSYSVSSNSNFNIDTSTNKIFINPSIYSPSIILGNSNYDISGTNRFYIYGNSIFNGNLSIGDIANAPSLVNNTDYIIKVNGNIGVQGTITTTSDERLKKNVRTYDNALDKILQSRGVFFNYINNDKTSIGVIAQEIEKIIPEIVETSENGYKNVNYMGLIGVLIEAIKELNEKINYKKE
jgi:hypothetical protein